MAIFDKVLEIYQKYYLCPYCLGRMFALLGTDTTNYDRGHALLLSLTLENHRSLISEKIDKKQHSIHMLKVLAERAKFIPAQKVMEKEGLKFINGNSEMSCYLCHNLFYNLSQYVDLAIQKINDIEFQNFLCGTAPSATIINKEDRFKSEFNLLESESFKNHFNRECGKILSKKLNKPTEFESPDLAIVFSLDYDKCEIELIIRSLFISGKYNKLIRGIPQTEWFCKNCKGNGCELCNFTGKQYELSVEQLISPPFISESKAIDSKFHGAGREDIDVRMLGKGRPFIIELRKPKVRSLNLPRIENLINESQKEKIKVAELRYSNKKEVIKVKMESENVRKVYLATVRSEKALDEPNFNIKLNKLKEKLEGAQINQRTPTRVSHRRANKVRKKIIYKVEGEYINSNLFKFVIETQGGTYIKELISSDEGKTSPSISEIFEDNLTCIELDVMEIKT